MISSAFCYKWYWCFCSNFSSQLNSWLLVFLKILLYLKDETPRYNYVQNKSDFYDVTYWMKLPVCY